MAPPPNRKLSESELAAGLATTTGWRLEEQRLHRVFRFEDFAQAFTFMTRCAFEAERLQHHPDWSNVYDRVEVQIWSHDLGGVSERCLELARAMERHAERMT